MEEDDDDIYGVASATNGAPAAYTSGSAAGPVKQEEANGGQIEEDDEEEEEEDSESDIDIITERKDTATPSATQTFKRVKQEPVRISAAPETSSAPQSQTTAAVKPEPTAADGYKLAVGDGSKYPEYRHSTIDLHNVPIYGPSGKPITEVDLDADVAMETKPWRIPGTDPTDFFNYGFDEFTWVQYCMKQNSTRSEVSGLRTETKQFEAMLSGQPQPGAMPSMPGMPDMNPEMMNAMFSSMQAQGVTDPSQLDFNGFMQQMQQMGGGMPGMPGFGPGQGGQNFGGGFGGQNMQQQGSNSGQSPFSGGYGGGTPQPQQQGLSQSQSFEGYSAQQMAMLQQQGGGQGGGRGRGRGRRW